MKTPVVQEDTIAAISTGLGGGIAVIRVSGAAALAVAGSVWRGRTALAAVPSRTMVLGRIVNADDAVEDQCLAVSMPGPQSYTGEDVVEFHCHGGAMVVRAILLLLLKAGARHAEPGEFTKRAFLNGRMDLTQVEAVLDVIQAQSEMALHAASRQLQGVLSRKVTVLYDALSEMLAEIEVRLDFVDEDLDWQPASKLESDLADAVNQIDELLRYRGEGEVLRQGVRLVIAGAPNAGKSSLMNLILGRDRAIVTDIPGTTRDTLEELAHIRGIPIRVIDTAGIRDSGDVVEQHGVARSRSSMEQAQIVLWVIDATRDFEQQKRTVAVPSGKSLIVVVNKVDLVPEIDFADRVAGRMVRMSALTGDGLPGLMDEIERCVWHHPHTEEPEVAVNARHCALLECARQQLCQSLDTLADGAFELIAVNVRAAIDALGSITGRTIDPDILDNIFRKFCIGK